MDTFWNLDNSFKILISVLIIMTNLLLILVVTTSRKLRKQRLSMVIVSLAVTDFIVGCMIPINSFMYKRWTFGLSFCYVMICMEIIMLSSSVYNFVLVNLDRLLAIKFPIKYHNMSNKYIKIGIAVCWLLALLPASPVWRKEKLFQEKDKTCLFPYKDDVWVWTAALLVFIIPTLAILTIWVMISLKLREGTKKYITEDRPGQRRREKQRRITVIMAILTSAFLLCWWPYAIYFMSGLEEPNVLGKLVILAYLNSLINPCLYIFINREVRNRIKNILSFNFARQEEFQELSSV